MNLLILGLSDSLQFKVGNLVGLGLSFRVDGFRAVYMIITTFMWLCSTALLKEYFKGEKNTGRYRIFSLITYLATMGVFASGDFYTTFCFFEIMSLASYVYVVQTEKKEAIRAAGTYLAVAVIGGLVMLMGLFMLYSKIGTLDHMLIGNKTAEILSGGDSNAIKEIYIAGFLILFGFGAKAGMFPLHIWLPKAHPVAPAPASALLSGVLTKSGIFGILILILEIFKYETGFGMVIYILGLVTMFTGAILAVFSVDAKRTLACSSVSQIGFILVGAGLIPFLKDECTLALSGTMLYMVNHSMFKLCLFLAIGALYSKCHKLNLNEIKGFGKDMPLLKALFAIGALGISGIPLFSGYIAKTLIHEGIVEFAGEAVSISGLITASEWIFLICGGMTFAYMTKLFICIFVEKPGKQTAEAKHGKKLSLLTIAGVAAPAIVIVFFGVFPNIFINKLAVLMGDFNNYSYSEEQLEVLSRINIFSLENLKGAIISIAIGTLIYVLIRTFLTRKEGDDRIYLNRWPEKIDIEDSVYRPVLLKVLPAIFGLICTILSKLTEAIVSFLSRFVFNELNSKPHVMLQKIYTKYEMQEKKIKIITASISCGLLFISFGLCLTIFYLLSLLIW